MVNPDITADITLYKTENGGRNTPTPQDYFNCPVELEGEKHDCRLFLENIGSIRPGETKRNVPIKFLCPELVMPKIHTGKKFYLWENKIIGEGIIK